MPKVASYGFIHDKAKANSTLGVSDCGDDVFYVIFASAVDDNVLFDLEIGGHLFTITGVPANTKTKFYWCLGASKDNTQVNFIDKKPVKESEVEWPTITEKPLATKLSVYTFKGDTATYPTNPTPAVGADGKYVRGMLMPVDTKTEMKNQIPKEDDMPFNKTSQVYPASQNILESEVGLVRKTHQAKGTDATLDETTGRKILKAGTLYTDETTKETGVVFEDYDLTDYDKFPISVVMQGRVKYDLCSEEAQAKIEDFKGQGLYLIGKVDD